MIIFFFELIDLLEEVWESGNRFFIRLLDFSLDDSEKKVFYNIFTTEMQKKLKLVSLSFSAFP